MAENPQSRLAHPFRSKPSDDQATPDPEPRILIFSQRNLKQIQPFRCAHFEFEDVISGVDAVDMLAPPLDPSTKRHAFARQLAYHAPFALNPGVNRPRIEKHYDLFLAICADPIDLLRVQALGPWREKCTKAVCLIDELWITLMHSNRQYLRMLEKFDAVALYYSQSIEPLNQRIGPKAFYLPPAVDTVRFCPFPEFAPRAIDVYSIGRRSAVGHRELLKMADNDGLFYMYDTTSADRMFDQAEHRALYANMLKRSRYFLVNPALVDRPDIRGSQVELGYRYFDGVAAGAILVGERPRNDVFEGLFDWSDSLLDLPYTSPDIADVIRTMDEQPEKQETLRRTNMQQALLRHDWVYRWEAILQRVGMSPLPRLSERRELLRSIADEIARGDREPADAPRQYSPTLRA